jgi:hypothetical protein
LVFEEETSDQQSILLAEIMNAIGFSKSEREIKRHSEHPRNLLMNIFRVARKSTITIAGSTAEGMRAIPTEFGKYSLPSYILVQFTSANDSLTYPGKLSSSSTKQHTS